METGIGLIAQERQEQISKHGFRDDSEYTEEELKLAALYVLTLDRQYYPAGWQFWLHDKLMAKKARLSEQDFYIEQLKICGAFCAAEIDRIHEAMEEPI